MSYITIENRYRRYEIYLTTQNRYKGYEIYLTSKIVIESMKGGDSTTGIKNIPRLLERKNDQCLRSDPGIYQTLNPESSVEVVN